MIVVAEHNLHSYVREDLIKDIFHGKSDLLQLFSDLLTFHLCL